MSAPHAGAPDRLATGTILDQRFEIVEFLGAGAFGEVYRARQLVAGVHLRDVALKLFAPALASPARLREGLADALVLIRLQEDEPAPEVSRRMIQVYDVGILQTPVARPFMSMRLVRGRRTLRHEIRRMREHGMPVALSLTWLRRLLIPLAWMHTRDPAAVHGDLKHENILVGPDGDLVLTDFGLAAHMPLGVTGGTVIFEAPEVLRAGLGTPETGGPESDVYSIGLIWYEMLTGRNPFESVGLEALADDDKTAYARAQYEARSWPFVAEERPRRGIPKASMVNPELAAHPALEALLETCLTPEVGRRVRNAKELLDKVEQYIGHGEIRDLIGRLGPASPAGPAPAIVELPTETVDTAIGAAEVLLAQGRVPEARSRLDQVLGKSPRNLRALLARALARASDESMSRDERWNGAFADCAAADTIAPDSADVLRAKAEVCDRLGEATMSRNFRRMAAERMATR